MDFICPKYLIPEEEPGFGEGCLGVIARRIVRHQLLHCPEPYVMLKTILEFLCKVDKGVGEEGEVGSAYTATDMTR